MLGNFPNTIFICVTKSISQINILFSIIQNSLLRVIPYFLRATQFLFGLLCKALLVVINYLILKHKQHTLGTFLVKLVTLQGKQ